MPLTQKDKSRLTQLRCAIDRAAQLYYTPGCESPLTDDEFEALMGELRALDPSDTRLIRVGVPYDVQNMRGKRTHAIPMGSLDNTDRSIVGFASWYDRVLGLLGYNPLDQLAEAPSVNVSLKMDGNSVALSYENGILTEAISRGNGEVGESLTANAVKWIGVPTCLPTTCTGTVRGEAILYRAEFAKLKKSDPDLTNPRNVGSGILGRIDGTQNELIRFVAFNLIDPKVEFPSLSMKFKVLEAMGFDPVQHISVRGTRDQIVQRVEGYFTEIEAQRDSLSFDIDGLVVMVDDVKLQKSITKDRKDELRPKYGRAVKFVTQKALTKVIGVTITVGHTGAIIPTADLEPVYVGGVTVDSALLNNWNENSESPSAAHVAIGDTVEVARQGDVIPKVVRVVTRPVDRQPITEPANCPECGAPTTRQLRGSVSVVTFCSSPDTCCGASLYKIRHYIGGSDKGVGIMGVGGGKGKGVLDALTREQPDGSVLVSSPADLYRLRVEQLTDLQIGTSKSGQPIRLGESRAAALIVEIEKSKQLSLTKFLGALGIDLLGRRRVEIIAKEHGLTTLEDWLDEETLRARTVVGVGDTIRKAITEGLRKARPLIDDLLSVGVTVIPYGAIQRVVFDVGSTETQEERESPMPEQKFAGKSFCFTGTRDLLVETAAAGGEIKSGVSKGLTYLVQKDATSKSNKTIKADEYGVKIISIETLRAALAGERDLP